MIIKILIDLLKVDRFKENEIMRGHEVTCE